METATVHIFDDNRLFCFYGSEYQCLVTTGLYYGLGLEEVKDIIQQLFLDFADKKIDLDSFAHPRSYILTSFKRKLIDHHRMQAKMKRRQALLCGEISETAVDKLMEEKEAFAELTVKLKAAYQKLPERCRRVIFLKYYEGLSNEEIRVRTGLSLRSIYNNLSEGVKLLRAALAAQPRRKKAASFFSLLLFCFP